MIADREKRFRELTAPLGERLVATAWRILRNEGDAEDAFQEGLLQVWKRLERVERHANPEALILRIGANAAYDRLRSRIREDRRRYGYGPQATQDARPGPDARAAETELSEALRAAIASLPRKRAQAAIMRLVQEQAYADIAAALGCKEATARVHVLKARKQLESLLDGFRVAPSKEIVS